jgi:tRNA-dihydrouridine synthase
MSWRGDHQSSAPCDLEQMYTPGINAYFIIAVNDASHIPVLVNGHVRIVEDAVSMVEENVCDSMMIVRGALDEPCAL